MSDQRWARAVRALALVSFVLLIAAIFEARAIRAVRAELQALRTERAHGAQSMDAVWARVSTDDVTSALEALNTLYEEPTEGLGRPGGLCADRRLNARAIAGFLRVFLSTRGTGASRERAIEAMREAVRSTDDFRAIHPDLAVTR